MLSNVNSEYGRQNIFLNNSISKRPVKNKLLFKVRLDRKNYEIWESTKTGTNLKKLFTCSEDDDWHVDVGNEIIRLIRQLGSEVKIEEFPW